MIKKLLAFFWLMFLGWKYLREARDLFFNKELAKTDPRAIKNFLVALQDFYKMQSTLAARGAFKTIASSTSKSIIVNFGVEGVYIIVDDKLERDCLKYFNWCDSYLICVVPDSIIGMTNTLYHLHTMALIHSLTGVVDSEMKHDIWKLSNFDIEDLHGIPTNDNRSKTSHAASKNQPVDA